MVQELLMMQNQRKQKIYKFKIPHKRMNSEQMILQKLEKIEAQLENIKEHMVDADTLLTAEEIKLLDKSIEHEKEGKLTSSEKLREELEL